MGKRIFSTEYFIKKSKKIHGDKYDYSLCVYKGSHIKVKIKCKNNHIFEQRPMDHMRGIGCKLCSDKNKGFKSKYSKNQLLRLLKTRYPNYDFIINDKYKNTNSIIEAICLEHGSIFKPASSFLKGKICYNCDNTKIGKLTFEHFIEKSNKVHNNLYNYDEVIIGKSQDKVKIKCNKHGYFNQTPNSHMGGQGCPKCKMSKGERKIMNLLSSKNIQYKYQYKFKKLNKYLFDFYLPKYNLCIEYDGELHYNKYNIFGGEKGLNKVKKRDIIKNKYCKDNNINLLRIPYWEFNNIEKILDTKIV